MGHSNVHAGAWARSEHPVGGHPYNVIAGLHTSMANTDGSAPQAPARGVTSHSSSAKEKPPQGGTACRCVCGHTVVWHREIFRGNMVRQKEYECEEQVCPAVSIPGLIAKGECTYVDDIQELTAGTVCLCICGGRVAWRGRAFYGNVTKERERECLEDVCPVVNPIPGLKFEAKCRFVPNLFTESSVRPQPPQPAKSACCRRRGSACAYLAGAVLFAWVQWTQSGA